MAAPWILHIATHGFYEPYVPHVSGKGDPHKGEWKRLEDLPGVLESGPLLWASSLSVAATDARHWAGASLTDKSWLRPLLRCGLAMAGARTWQESAARESGCTGSGIVTGLELRNLDLRGTKLVTLSACQATQLQRVGLPAFSLDFL